MNNDSVLQALLIVEKPADASDRMPGPWNAFLHNARSILQTSAGFEELNLGVYTLDLRTASQTLAALVHEAATMRLSYRLLMLENPQWLIYRAR